MANNIRSKIKTLERLSLVTCSEEVLTLLERSLKNVEPILRADTRGVEPLVWQNNLTMDRLHDDQPRIGLTKKALKQNASSFYEDYIAIGLKPKARDEAGKNS